MSDSPKAETAAQRLSTSKSLFQWRHFLPKIGVSEREIKLSLSSQIQKFRRDDETLHRI